MSQDDDKEIIATLHVELDRAYTKAKTAVKMEEAGRFGEAIVIYRDVAIQLLHFLCFSSGKALRKTSSKSSTAKININNSQIIEETENKIVDIYTRIWKLDNVASSGSAETFSLMRSIDIPLDIDTSIPPSSITTTTSYNYENVKNVLIEIDINTQTDTFENIIGHRFTKEKLLELAHIFALNVNENTKNILRSRNVSSNMMVILYGEPGTGKTSLVRALAHRMNVKLYELKLSSMYNKYMGDSEKLMSAIFDWILSSNEPKIVFFDELDSLFTKRGANNEESLDKKLKIIFMTEMNKFKLDLRTNTLIIGATNLIDDLDEAITRRSLLNINVGKPESIEEYLELTIHEFSKLKMNVENDIYRVIAEMAMKHGLAQSKIVDIVQKLFAIITSRLTDELYVKLYRNSDSCYSLNGKLLGPGDDKLIITNENDTDAEAVLIDSEKGTVWSDNIVLPFVTVQMFRENAKALIEKL